VADPSRLYRIGDADDCCVDGGFPGDAGGTSDFSIFSYDLYQHFKSSAPEFEQLAAVQASEHWSWSVRRGNTLAKSLSGEFVSGNYFSTLGVRPYAGRAFDDNDDTPGAAPATVLSYKTWQGEFAVDPAIVGSTIFIQTKTFYRHRYWPTWFLW
jgi:macrolide transport system ATP-binding/permease protein